ncbi:MAG: hypothetical protein ACI4XE_07050 [Acutalibacteraceae bacterium]
MNRIEIKANEVVVKRNNLLIVFGVFVLGIGIGVVPMLLDFPKPEITGEYELSEVFGFLFGCLWLLVISGNGIFCITAGFKRIVIDSDGVTCKGLFGVKKLSWSAVADYGVYWDGQTRPTSFHEYVLYFADAVLPVNRKLTKKKPGRNTVKTHFLSVRFSDEPEKILAFCRRYSSVTPFICDEDKALNRR